jgi:hypothetical protein
LSFYTKWFLVIFFKNWFLKKMSDDIWRSVSKI